MNNCIACNSSGLTTVLNFPCRIPYTGTDNIFDKEYPCTIVVCDNCKHIQTRNSESLYWTMRDKLYATDNVISTPTGDTGWAAIRSERIVAQMLGPLSSSVHRVQNALEIGCQNGYLLKVLKDNGVENVLGVDPAPVKAIDGIPVIHQFFEDAVLEKNSFDIIVANALFEHVCDLRGFVKKIYSLLKSGGRFVIEVPDAQAQLMESDIGMFIHEHVSHFYPDMLIQLFSSMGFQVNLDIRRPGIVISAYKDGSTSFREYSNSRCWDGAQFRMTNKLDYIVDRINNLPRPLVLLGACIITSNLFAWEGDSIKDKDNIYVVDDDPLKIGKTMTYLPGKIESRKILKEDPNIKDVMIMPFAYTQKMAETIVPGVRVGRLYE